MATQSLYRRYRPRRFSELKGQDHVVRALRDAVVSGREGQAYLFSGPRGTGKTTSARILAKVLNCENVIDGEPCCECESCLAVERGTSYDVHELDAASNNGVDAIRDLVEKASLGTPGRHKVYILDEVHMLSKAAEAALLKTLEEPPPHVVFVLATTDPQKMSDTIRSRTQHLQFHLLPSDTMADHAKWVAEDAGLDLSPQAIEAALIQGGGSARDTLSALELLASTGGDVSEVIDLDEFLAALIERDPGRVLTAMGHAVSLGRDPRTVTEDIVRHLRNAFLSLMAPELVVLPRERLDAIAAQAQQLGAAGLVRAIERLGSALVDMRHAPDPRILVEVALVQLTHDAAGSDADALAVRLERLEEKVRLLRSSGPAHEPSTVAAPTDPTTGRAVLGGAARRPTPGVAAQVDDSGPARDPVATESDRDRIACVRRSAGTGACRRNVGEPRIGRRATGCPVTNGPRRAPVGRRCLGADGQVTGQAARASALLRRLLHRQRGRHLAVHRAERSPWRQVQRAPRRRRGGAVHGDRRTDHDRVRGRRPLPRRPRCTGAPSGGSPVPCKVHRRRSRGSRRVPQRGADPGRFDRRRLGPGRLAPGPDRPGMARCGPVPQTGRRARRGPRPTAIHFRPANPSNPRATTRSTSASSPMLRPSR